MRKKAVSGLKRRHKHTDYQAASDVKDEVSLYEIIASCPDSPFLLILDCIQDPHNLGACLRTADAAGVHAVVVPKDRSASLTPTVRHIACGAAESVPLIVVTNLVRVLKELKKMGVWLVGTTDDARKSFYEIDLSGPLAIIMGAEGKGLRRLTREQCDFLAYLPMKGKVECLNVSVATGICLYEALRQRGEV